MSAASFLLDAITRDLCEHGRKEAERLESPPNIQALAAVEGLHLSTLEDPVLVRERVVTWLNFDNVAVVGSCRRKTVIVVEVDANLGRTAEGRRLRRGGEGSRKSDVGNAQGEHLEV